MGVRRSEGGYSSLPPPGVELLAAAVRFARESYCITDADLDGGPRIVYVNPAFTQLTGYGALEVVGKTPRLLQGPRTDRSLLDRLKAQLRAGEEFQGETINYRKDGTAFLMRWYVTPIRDDSGTVTHYLGVQNDATAQRAAEATRQAFARALEMSPDPVALLDDKGCIRTANAALLRELDASLDSVRGRTLRSVGASPSSIRAYRDLLQTVQLHGEYNGELTKHRGERRRVYETSVRRIEGDDPAYLVTFRDVTQRRRFQAIAEAASFVENTGYLFASLRHELGNPINSIKTALTVVRQAGASLDRARMDGYLDRVLAEVSRVEYLLRNLRAFNAFDRPQVTRVAIGEFLERLTSMVQAYCKQQGVDLAVSYPSNIAAQRGDARALHQIFLNLLNNSAEAMAGSERRSVLIAATQVGPNIVWSFSDNGPGIPSERRAEIFKPFHTTKAGGTGLGLAIVRKLVTEMHGTIELSAADVGAVFILTFDADTPDDLPIEDAESIATGEDS